jgi:GT2 family glycosyltransferase
MAGFYTKKGTGMRTVRGKKRVSGTVLNWIGKDFLAQCIESMLESDYPFEEIVISANDPDDAALETVRRLHPRVVILRNPANLGVSKGKNVAIRYALQKPVDYVFLFDNDLFLDPRCIGELVSRMETHSEIGTLGAFIYDAGEREKLLSAGGLIDYSQNITRQLKSPGEGALVDVDYCGAGAVLVRRTAFDSLGLLSEKYIGYGFEDADFGMRLKNAGYRVCTCPAAKVWHMPHSNIGVYTFRKKYLETRNAVVFMKRHGNFRQKLKYTAYFFLGIPYLVVHQGILKGRFAGVMGKVRGMIDGLSSRESLAHRILLENNSKPRVGS